MTIKNVVVAGGGVLGSQIAYQAAYKGFAVTVWLRSEGSVERAKPKFEQLRQTISGNARGDEERSRGVLPMAWQIRPTFVDEIDSSSSSARRRSRARVHHQL